MASDFHCPHCDASYPLRPVLIGKAVRCTRCSKGFRLQADGRALPLSRVAKETADVAASARPPPPDTSARRRTVSSAKVAAIKKQVSSSLSEAAQAALQAESQKSSSSNTTTTTSSPRSVTAVLTQEGMRAARSRRRGCIGCGLFLGVAIAGAYWAWQPTALEAALARLGEPPAASPSDHQRLQAMRQRYLLAAPMTPVVSDFGAVRFSPPRRFLLAPADAVLQTRLDERLPVQIDQAWYWLPRDRRAAFELWQSNLGRGAMPTEFDLLTQAQLLSDLAEAPVETEVAELLQRLLIGSDPAAERPSQIRQLFASRGWPSFIELVDFFTSDAYLLRQRPQGGVEGLRGRSVHGRLLRFGGPGWDQLSASAALGGWQAVEVLLTSSAGPGG